MVYLSSFGFICRHLILEVRAPKRTWVELIKLCSPEHKQNKDPPETQKTQTEKGYELTSLPVLPLQYQSFLSSFLSTPAMLRGCLMGQKVSVTFGCPPFFLSSLGLSSHTSWAIVHCKHVGERVSVNVRLSAASTPRAPFPPQHTCSIPGQT